MQSIFPSSYWPTKLKYKIGGKIWSSWSSKLYKSIVAPETGCEWLIHI